MNIIVGAAIRELCKVSTGSPKAGTIWDVSLLASGCA
jgi:hypothetical protein